MRLFSFSEYPVMDFCLKFVEKNLFPTPRHKQKSCNFRLHVNPEQSSLLAGRDFDQNKKYFMDTCVQCIHSPLSDYSAVLCPWKFLWGQSREVLFILCVVSIAVLWICGLLSAQCWLISWISLHIFVGQTCYKIFFYSSFVDLW